MCLGNHDYGNNLDLTNNSQHQIDYGIQSQKEGKKWIMPSNYYTFKKKNIQFFVMDTNFDFMDDKEIKEQFDYLVKEINKSKFQAPRRKAFIKETVDTRAKIVALSTFEPTDVNSRARVARIFRVFDKNKRERETERERKKRERHPCAFFCLSVDDDVPLRTNLCL